MEEDEREGQENQPEPEIESGPEDEGKEELPESETQPVAPGEVKQEQSVPWNSATGCTDFVTWPASFSQQ